MGSVVSTIIASVMLFISGGVVAGDAAKLSKCSCSNNYTPHKWLIGAAVCFFIAGICGLVGGVIQHNSQSKAQAVLKVVSVIFSIIAVVLTAITIKPTHEDCSCAGSKSKVMEIVGTTLGGISAILMLRATFKSSV